MINSHFFMITEMENDEETVSTSLIAKQYLGLMFC